MKHPLRIVLFKESPYNLIDVLDPISVIVQPCYFYQVKFSVTSSANKTAKKVTKILQFLAFNWNLSHSDLCSTHGAINF